MLEAANNNIVCITKVFERPDEDRNEERNVRHIASSFGEILYYNSIVGENDGLDEKFECSQFSNNPQHEIDEHLQVRLCKASKDDMPEKRCENVRENFERNNKVFGLRLVSGPADLILLEISLDVTNKPNRSRDRRYIADQRASSGSCLYQPFRYGILIPDITVTWKAALSLPSLS